MLKPLDLKTLLRELTANRDISCYAITHQEFRSVSAELKEYCKLYPTMRSEVKFPPNEMRIHGVRICIATLVVKGFDPAGEDGDRTSYAYYTGRRSGKTAYMKRDFERWMRNGGFGTFTTGV